MHQGEKQPEPLRLLLLGTAGSGKTRAVQTALQEIQRNLAAAGLPFDVDPREFVRVAAPTGTAAFNLRFHATTVHRLIHWFTPPFFKTISDDRTLYELQKQLRNTQLIILDEVSMIGRQMMGRIDSRMEQAKGYQNERSESLGGVSCVAVGDPAQCEAMHDQQSYNTTPHKGTANDGDKQHVQLSNRGLEVYSSFTKVIVLTKTHRLTMIKEPKTKAEHEFNARAEKFVAVLRRLRDLEWTCEDYYWLCKRKRSQLSFAERASFADAPVIMDFRRTTEDNPEENCECYNKAYLRAMAHKDNLPVIRVDAEHDGIEQAEGLKLDESRFNGLAAQVELCEGARVILIHNLAVEFGLMNGTQGVVKQIVFAKGSHPRHEDPRWRMPEAVVVDFPKYAGPTFFDEPERRTWVPILVREGEDGDKQSVVRRQFPLILGWAMTPWKAQGMTLDRAIVRLTRAAASPGVAFVALSRVRHPDHLMLEDSFPDMATIMKQTEKESFQTRQRWERKMRVLFSRTVRTYMDDSTLYSPEKVWTQEENDIADALLAALRTKTDATDEELIGSVRGRRRKTVADVWSKLHTFPHMFEVYAARGEDLMNYDLHGEPRKAVAAATTLTQLSYRGWNVGLTDFDALLEKGVLEPSTWELLANVLRSSLPRDVLLRQAHMLRKQKTGVEHLPRHANDPRVQIFPYRSNSKQWAMFIVTRIEEKRYSLRAIVPMNHDEEAFSWAVNHLKYQFRIKEDPLYTQWPSNVGAQLLVADGLLQALAEEPVKTAKEKLERFVTETLTTLRRVRNAAVRAHNINIDEICNEDSTLQSDFE